MIFWVGMLLLIGVVVIILVVIALLFIGVGVSLGLNSTGGDCMSTLKLPFTKLLPNIPTEFTGLILTLCISLIPFMSFKLVMFSPISMLLMMGVG